MTSPTRSLLPLAAAAALLCASLPAAATHVELQGGRSYMDSHAANAVFVESVFAAHPLGASGLHWAPDVALGWIDGRGFARYRDARYGTADAIWLAAGGVRLNAGGPDDWYHPFFYSFQVALHGGRTQALSSVYEFVNSVGWQWRHFSVRVRHISNGGLHKPNRGETMALVGVGFDL
ncbi:acyloxyacyl hydrolase [Rhodanobacter sp. PCA2]|uniref:acyloxyacyl hydrolase n=1 Tax=Rhodanobacter sp. PCA2 TaxID=2006117 RepID=UPI0015E690A2|nr:acyloxyacyl hydrolase [Rhodanobacter sp. PCA2]MBA2077054.1 lipid A 3-O-deacylase [Rhodanobacter sp. PCA2]